MSAHEPSPRSTAAVPFSAGSDSPVRTASSQDNSETSRSRKSAGTMSPISSMTMSPGTSATTSTRCAAFVSHNERGVTDLAVECRDRLFGAELVEEPQADRERDDHRDDDGVGSLPDERGDGCGGQQQEEQGIAELSHEDAPRHDPVAAERVGAMLDQPALRLGCGQARGTSSEPLEHELDGRPRRGVEIRLHHGHEFAVPRFTRRRRERSALLRRQNTRVETGSTRG